jgi:hypothetical protein
MWMARHSIQFGVSVAEAVVILSSMQSSREISRPNDLSFLSRSLVWEWLLTVFNESLQPTPGSGSSSAARFTSLGPAWLSLGR